MILAMDTGNTQTVFGCVRDGAVAPILRIATDRAETPFGYAAKMKQVFELCGVESSSFEGAIIASVVPPVTDVLVGAVKLLTGLDALVVGAGLKTGLHIAIDDPGTMAADLVATAVAAKEEYPLPCVVVDMGTATTLTVVDGSGRYIGGAILPGVDISMSALNEETSLLPRIEIAPPTRAVATNTVDSMRAGIVYGTAGSLDGLLDRFAQQLGREPASIVATGGAAALICRYCRHAIRYDETLLLKGLGLIWDRNRPKTPDKGR